MTIAGGAAVAKVQRAPDTSRPALARRKLSIAIDE